MGAFVVSWTQRVPFVPGSPILVETARARVVYADSWEDANNAIADHLRAERDDVVGGLTAVDVSDKLADIRPIPPRPAMLRDPF